MFKICETWSLTLWDERRLRVFENRKNAESDIGPKSDENGEWRRIHNGERLSLYRSNNIVRLIKSGKLRWEGHLTRM